MSVETKVIAHYTNFAEFEFFCLEKGAIAFPELENVMYAYVLSKPEKTIEFKECWIHYEKGEDDMEVRTVQVTFQDDNINKVLRLWGAREIESGKVLKMTIDFIDSDTLELEYEHELEVK